MLERQVRILQDKLEQVKQEAAADKVTNNFTEVNEGNVELEDATEDNTSEALENTSEEPVENNLEENNMDTTEETNDAALENDVDEVLMNVESDEVAADYDVILQVKPEKIPQIKSQIIDGKKFIMIPIDEDEQTTVNGIDSLI